LAGLQDRLRRLEHGPRRSRGTQAVYAAYRSHISRRAFATLVDTTRRAVQHERHADQRRIDWLRPGTVWSVDPTELVLLQGGGRQKLLILPVLDLAARYKLPPLLGVRLTGAVVAAHLEKLFEQFGAPLVLKRDNGSNLNSTEVNEVLSRWRIIPLNSPPHYPPYNGSIERSQRELKAALRPRLLAAGDAPTAWPGLAALAVHELNHQPRRCLRGQTACAKFASAKTNQSGYRSRQRKECFEQISELAMNAMLELPVRAQGQADAAWRRAVETWLQQEGLIGLHEPKTVTQFP
jgi:transposase InsO family protein